MKVEIQRSNNKIGFWIYLVKSNGKSFMLRWVKYSKCQGWNENLEKEYIEEAERLIKFIKEDI